MFKTNRLLLLATALYVLLYFACCMLKFYTFAYDDFDLAHHDQMVWNLLHGRIYNSILGIDFLGNHVHFLTFLIAPIYYFFQHPLFLLFLQTIFLAAGAIPLYHLSRLYLDEELSVFVGLVYLFYPALGYVNLFEFHPTCFACFFLFCCAYYFYRQEFMAFNIFMLLSLLCQENMALIFLMWGPYALILKRPWKWVWWPSLLGFMYFLLCVEVILPHFNHNKFNFFSIYGELGGSLGQVALTCLVHPLKVLGIMFKPLKIVYLAELLISVSFLPLLSLWALLPVFLIFLQHLLSSRASEISLHFHYTAELIPFIFVAFIFGIRNLTSLKLNSRLIGSVLLFNAILAHGYFGPHLHLLEKFKELREDYGIGQKTRMLEEIPPDASVVTTFNFLSHLSHRENLYSFHYVFYGFYTLSDHPYHLPDKVDYALIDFNDWLTFGGFYGLSNYQHLVDFFRSNHWGAIDVENNVVLFKKGADDKYRLFDILKDRPIPSHSTDDLIDQRIKLYGYDAKLIGTNQLQLILYWKPLKPESKDIHWFIDFIDYNGKIFAEQIRPMDYQIWPTQAWKPGEYIKEYQYISLTPSLMGRIKHLSLGFFDFATGKLVATSSQISLSIQ